MFGDYHRAIVDAEFDRLNTRVLNDAWTDLKIRREKAVVFTTISVEIPQPYKYVARIDVSRYPVEPYWVGFINPDLAEQNWNTASDSDPRFWPWSPMPGLHGSFIVTFQGPFRTFWCRECNFPFFLYHGLDHRWSPNDWHLDRVVAHLRDALGPGRAEPPVRWRPIQQQALMLLAKNANLTLPPDAGLGAK